MKSFLCCKLSRQIGKNVEKWMGSLGIAVTECYCEELDRQLREWFINGLNANDILKETICELSGMKDTSIVTSEQVLAWSREVKTH